MGWDLRNKSKLWVAGVIGLFAFLAILSNLLGDLGGKWFVLVTQLGVSVFLLIESHIVEMLTNSPSGVLKAKNIMALFSGFMAGVLIISSVLVFVSMSGFGFPSQVLSSLKMLNVIGGLFCMVLAVVYART